MTGQKLQINIWTSIFLFLFVFSFLLSTHCRQAISAPKDFEFIPQLGHSDRVTGIEITKNQRLLISASQDHTIKISDFKDGKVLKTLYGHKKGIVGIGLFSQDQKLVSADENTLFIWDIEKGSLLQTILLKTILKNDVSARLIQVNPIDHTLVIAATDSTLIEFDLLKGIVKKELKSSQHISGYFKILEINPHNKTVYLGTSNGELVVWNLKTTKIQYIKMLSRKKERISPGSIDTISKHPTKPLLFIGIQGYFNHKSKKRSSPRGLIWSLRKKKITGYISLDKRVEGYNTIHSQIGEKKKLYIARKTFIEVSDIDKRKRVQIFSTITDKSQNNTRSSVHKHSAIRITKLSHDKKFVIVGYQKGGLQKLNLKTQKLDFEISGINNNDYVNMVNFNNGLYLYNRGRSSISEQWNVNIGARQNFKVRELTKDKKYLQYFTFPGQDHDFDIKTQFTDKFLNIEVRSINKNSLENNKIISTKFRINKKHNPFLHNAISISPDGKYIALLSKKHSDPNNQKSGFPTKKKIHIYRIRDKRWIKTIDLKDSGPTNVIFSHDSKHLIIPSLLSGWGKLAYELYSISLHDNFSLYRLVDENLENMGSSEKRSAYKTDITRILSVPNTDLIITGGLSGIIKIWNLKTKKLTKVLKSESHKGYITALTASQDGQFLFSATNEGQLEKWNIETGNLEKQFETNSQYIAHLETDETGEKIITVSSVGIMNIFNTNSGELLLSIYKSPDHKEWVAITPEGFFNASEKGAQILNIVKDLNYFDVQQVFNALYRPDLVKEKLAGDPNGLVQQAATKLDLEKIIQTGLPPNLELVSTNNISGSEENRKAVDIRISDVGGGIGRIEWRINGITIAVDGKTSDESTLNLTKELRLTQEKNEIEILAYNAQNLIASQPLKFQLSGIKEDISKKKNLYIFAIGLDDYADDKLDLRYARADASTLASQLKKTGDPIFNEIKLTTLFDKDVTLQNIDKIFQALSQDIHPEDVFLFYVAGHGKTQDGRYYFIPHDFQLEDTTSFEKFGVNQETWQKWLALIAARKSILIYDTCESGSLIKDSILSTQKLENQAALLRLNKATGRTILSATTGEEPAFEGYKGHGVFTYVILDALKKADKNKNKLIDVYELANYVKKVVPIVSEKAFGFKQTPQVRITGANFSFAQELSLAVK